MPKPSLKTLAISIFTGILISTVIHITTIPCFAETTPPTSTVTKNPSNPNGDDDWYKSPVEATILSIDLESGVKEINYKLDSQTWQKATFDNTLNLAPNPSFETDGLYPWEPTVIDGNSNYTQDTTNYAPGFGVASAKIVSTGAGWHGLNHRKNFSVSQQYNHMSTSLWLKTQDVSGSAYYKVYALHSDDQTTLISQSSGLSGTQNWQNLQVNFDVPEGDILGIYIDVGLDGTGTVWADAVNTVDSMTQAQVKVTISSDGEHTLSYYGIDRLNNTETTKTENIKIDQTPPGNWHNISVIRVGGSAPEYELKVSTDVEDTTSGLSTDTNKYQYKITDSYGKYSELLNCSSSWEEDGWADLELSVDDSGDHQATLRTQNTSFCDSNWGICKFMRFYAKDVAGNTTTKDYCVNGSWIQTIGKGATKSNLGIDMSMEAPEYNTSGVTESKNSLIEFFSNEQDWNVKNAGTGKVYTYDNLWQLTDTAPSQISELTTDSGVFYHTGDWEISSLPSGYSTNTFTQVIFVDGELTISTNLNINNNSTVLFIVKGNVNIDKSVTAIDCAIGTDETFDTAYNAEDNEFLQPINFNGVFWADKFLLKRINVDSSTVPSEKFTYEPKYLIEMADYLGKPSIEWKTVD